MKTARLLVAIGVVSISATLRFLFYANADSNRISNRLHARSA